MNIREAAEQALRALNTCRVSRMSEWEVTDITEPHIKKAIRDLEGALQGAAEGGDLAALLKRIVRQVSDASYTQGIDERLDSPTRDEKNDSKVRALLGEASAAIDRLAALASKVQPKGTAQFDWATVPGELRRALGLLLKWARCDRHISLHELGETLGMTSAYLSQFERGRKYITERDAEAIRKWAQALAPVPWASAQAPAPVAEKPTKGFSTPYGDADDSGEAPAMDFEPVAWMYERDGMVHDADHPPICTTNRWQRPVVEPWTETPLYAVPVPPGMALVPVTPTPEMLIAGCDADEIYVREDVPEMWAAMLAAAPANPSPAVLHGKDQPTYAQIRMRAELLGRQSLRTDAEVHCLAERAGFKWIEPDGDDDGFPGGFDMSDFKHMRRLVDSLTVDCQSCDGSGVEECGDPETGSVIENCGRCNGTGRAQPPVQHK